MRVHTGSALVSTRQVAGSATSVVVSGLTNQTAYSFDVRATNEVGTGPSSSRSAVVTPRVEFVPPTVTARAPAAGATGVRRGADVTATFSEAVTGATTRTVQLTRVSTGAAVRASVSVGSRNRLTLDPSVTLAAHARYRVTVVGGTTAVRDRAGNPLATSTWTFTTGSGR